MANWKGILGVGLGVAIAGLGVKAILNKKANKENEDEEYIVDDEVETNGSAEESAE